MENKKNDLINVKGTQDYNFEDSILLNYIFDTIKKKLEANGFNPFETSKLEYMKTLVGKYDEDSEIVNEIFKVKNRGDRDIGLRYDLTVPLIRYISQNFKKIKFPFRRYQSGCVFRDGPIKKGRLREFIQFDFDSIGDSSIESEANSLITYFKIYESFGIKSILELNNNKILKGALMQFGFLEKDIESLTLSIDKLKKIGEEKVLDEIESKGFNRDIAKKSLDILNSKSISEILKKCDNEVLKSGIEELENLTKYLKNVNFRINFSMSRGLNIYTGNICEVYDSEKIVESSIGAGGRYDNAISSYLNSKELFPSFGYSFGIASIFEILKEKKNKSVKKNVIDILLVPLKKEFFSETLIIKDMLNQRDFNCDITYFYNIKKSFSYCESYEIENICIIGENEIKQKEIKVKNLRSGSEKIFNFF